MNGNPSSASDPVTGLITRRAFLQRNLMAASALALPQIIPANLLGRGGTVAPSNKVTVGLIGKGLMGSGHLERLDYDSSFQLVAVCDVDSVRREKGRTAVDDIYAATQSGSAGRVCTGYNDYREVLARSDIDAV